ncbi:hypothetical protein [uncultured Legionella sp.]|uniref:hypothetical protein n=1 Tax=uncultured Legionella sp. TaxID=210934 RepID=UPI0026034515|nr:hypothetical protein [uncultured Legionella sp.]
MIIINLLSVGYTTNNELFRVLLENKANACHKNARGETALDVAFMKKNKAAIEEIFKYAKKNNLSLSALMSPETQEKAKKWASVDVSKSDHKFFIANPLSDVQLFVQENLLWVADTVYEAPPDSSTCTIC